MTKQNGKHAVWCVPVAKRKQSDAGESSGTEALHSSDSKVVVVGALSVECGEEGISRR